MLVADPETLPGAEPLYRSKDSLTIWKFKATGETGKTLQAGGQRHRRTVSRWPENHEKWLK